MQVGELVLLPDAEPPSGKLIELANSSPKFVQTWKHERTDLNDQSQSGCDMSLATMAAIASWTNQEIANLLIAARRQHHTEKPLKALGQAYVARTIARARRTAAEMPVEDPEVDLTGILDSIRKPPIQGAD